VNYKDDLDTLAVLKQLTKQGYRAIALELTTTSKALEDLDIPEKRPVALFIGNEKTGISTKVLANIPTHVHIPMQGNNSSMNVTQAAAIGLYGLSLKIKEI
jgi:tRNA G18 (ribose-2'-O)-methylase SpoU